MYICMVATDQYMIHPAGTEQVKARQVQRVKGVRSACACGSVCGVVKMRVCVCVWCACACGSGACACVRKVLWHVQIITI